MSQTSKITVTTANGFLSQIFKGDSKNPRYMGLFTSDSNFASGTLKEPTGASYKRYSIEETDFNVANATATTKNHILFGLCDDKDGWGEIQGFGIFDSLTGSNCMYWGMLERVEGNLPVVTYNTVPVFKLYKEADGENSEQGIKVTLDVADTAEASSN